MKMTEQDKRNVPAGERGVPNKSGTGSYPMPDAEHAAAAIGFASMHHGPAFAAKIRAKAHELGFSGGGGDTKPKRTAGYGGKVFQE